MLARMNSTNSNPSTFVQTNSDSQSIGNNFYTKKNSLSNNYSSSDENKLPVVEIKVRSSYRRKSESQKLLTQNTTTNSLARSLRIITDNQTDRPRNLKPILKNKKRINKTSISLSLNDYQGKTIKFSDDIGDRPLAEVFIVESYKKYNDDPIVEPIK